jgi:hypothetical protein
MLSRTRDQIGRTHMLYVVNRRIDVRRPANAIRFSTADLSVGGGLSNSRKIRRAARARREADCTIQH